MKGNQFASITINAPLGLELSFKLKILIWNYNHFFNMLHACEISLVETKLGTKLKRAPFLTQKEFDPWFSIFCYSKGKKPQFPPTLL